MVPVKVSGTGSLGECAGFIQKLYTVMSYCTLCIANKLYSSCSTGDSYHLGCGAVIDTRAVS